MTYVYAIKDSQRDRIKIGYSANPLKRVKALGSSLELVAAIQGTRRVEREIHFELDNLALGNEWFQDTPEVIAALTKRGLVSLEQLPEIATVIVRTQLTEREWKDIRKEAVTANVTSGAYATQLIRVGRNCLSAS